MPRRPLIRGGLADILRRADAVGRRVGLAPILPPFLSCDRRPDWRLLSTRGYVVRAERGLLVPHVLDERLARRAHRMADKWLREWVEYCLQLDRRRAEEHRDIVAEAVREEAEWLLCGRAALAEAQNARGILAREIARELADLYGLRGAWWESPVFGDTQSAWRQCGPLFVVVRWDGPAATRAGFYSGLCECDRHAVPLATCGIGSLAACLAFVKGEGGEL